MPALAGSLERLLQRPEGNGHPTSAMSASRMATVAVQFPGAGSMPAKSRSPSGLGDRPRTGSGAIDHVAINCEDIRGASIASRKTRCPSRSGCGPSAAAGLLHDPDRINNLNEALAPESTRPSPPGERSARSGKRRSPRSWLPKVRRPGRQSMDVSGRSAATCWAAERTAPSQRLDDVADADARPMRRKGRANAEALQEVLLFARELEPRPA